MDKTTAINSVRQYAEVVKKHFNVKKIILYGSYAKNTAHKDSDIDVAVVLEHTNEDFLKSETKLFRLRRGIDMRIEPVLFEGADDRSGFLWEILQTGEVIYDAQDISIH